MTTNKQAKSAEKKQDSHKNGHASKNEETKSQAKAKETEANDFEELDEGEELNELLNLLEESELPEIDPDEATALIEEWHDILNGSGDADLKEIGKNLTKLKKALSASKPKPEAIAEVLSQLGEQTDEYANNAERGYKTKLHKLGKSLSKAGKSLEEQEEE